MSAAKARPRNVLTTLGYALLGLLRQGPASGYALRKVFETTPMGVYSSSPGTIYPAIRRLQAKGLVHRLPASASPTGKAAFALTEAGTNALRDWLRRPIAREDVVRKAPELLLRFVFLHLVEDASITRRFLEDFRRHAASYLEELESLRGAVSDQIPRHSLLALEHGIEAFRAHRTWADHALLQTE